MVPEITSDDRISAYGALVETQRRLHRIFDRSLRSSAGISIVWYEAMLRLSHAPDCHMPINELGDALDLTSGGATRLVDRLVAEGYVERLPCPTDRRVSWVGLTEKGHQVLSAATEVHIADLDDSFVGVLEADEMKTLRDLLRRLRPPT